MAVGSTPRWHRLGSLDILSGSNFQPGASRVVNILPRGAVVDGAQSGVSTLTVRAGHGVVTGQKFMIGTDEAKFYTAGTVTATTIPLSSGTVTASDGDVVVNLGNDSGTTSPNYDSTTVPIYANFANASAVATSTRTTDSNGKYEYWSTYHYVWELILDASGDPDTIVRDIELNGIEEVISLQEVAAGPSADPASSAEVQIYLKGDKLIIRFNDAGTVKYRSMTLTGTTNPAVWDYAAVEP